MEKERQLLVIFPHPDDEAFGVSGTIAQHVANGTPVTYACLTLGEMGRNMGNPPFATRESLPKIRKQELINAANVLGIKDLRMMGLRDKTIEFEDDDMLTEMMTSLIAEVEPSLVISFYPGYAVHPDHDATGVAVVRAVGKLPAKERPKLHCVAFSKNCEQEIGEPDIVNNVSSVADIKINAIKAHLSQTQLTAATMSDKLNENDPEVIARMLTERFWTYQF
ncbi:bacillithiol biosynthesis deacetylase BshB2 [Bacillus sp. DNRA2]|uniref:bacillithiol biosynthesis deacetylase BshB2 n=1 Tax=Bacillus sp. DNRA2 TaxID=2723053 RepID=UPI00145F5563|nr:bacillithiol biosynthesis deacetylase BshB2 [Bacillus sp. DNRA2]NMD72336.1 bacillithiol biosynthesis deacetylase BshB2 [Bacillus sp. DNRA2]